MGKLADTITETLAPYVGRMAADTCVRATALAIGKTTETLSTEDLPALGASVRRVLASVLPHTKIESIVAQIEAGVKPGW